MAIVIDGRGHLLGRLASVIAKELLNGTHIHLVRAEEINISGSRTCRGSHPTSMNQKSTQSLVCVWFACKVCGDCSVCAGVLCVSMCRVRVRVCACFVCTVCVGTCMRVRMCW
jgi:hypothetical protein